MLQQNPLLNETDLYADDDRVTKRIPQQNLQTPQPPHTFRTLLFEIQYHFYIDSHLSQDILIKKLFNSKL